MYHESEPLIQEQDTVHLLLDAEDIGDICEKPEIHAASYRVRSLWRRARDDLHRVAHPRYAYRLFELHQPDAMGNAPLANWPLRRALEASHAAVIVVLTLGKGVDRLLEEVKLEHPSYAVVLDEMASTLTDELIERVHRSFTNLLAVDESLTERFSPGYCAWPLAQQQILFSLMGEETAGVRLGENLLMSPRKSVSAIFGIGPQETVAQWGNPCLRCARRGCPHRRAAYQPHLRT